MRSRKFNNSTVAVILEYEARIPRIVQQWRLNMFSVVLLYRSLILDCHNVIVVNIR